MSNSITKKEKTTHVGLNLPSDLNDAVEEEQLNVRRKTGKRPSKEAVAMECIRKQLIEKDNGS